MYYDKELARNSLQQIENAILKIEERASSFHSADDFLKTPFGMAMLDAICMQFIAIGESLKGLDKNDKQQAITNSSRNSLETNQRLAGYCCPSLF